MMPELEKDKRGCHSEARPFFARAMENKAVGPCRGRNRIGSFFSSL